MFLKARPSSTALISAIGRLRRIGTGHLKFCVQPIPPVPGPDGIPVRQGQVPAIRSDRMGINKHAGSPDLTFSSRATATSWNFLLMAALQRPELLSWPPTTPLWWGGRCRSGRTAPTAGPDHPTAHMKFVSTEMGTSPWGWTICYGTFKN
jgi:hypothetical protein